MFEWMHANCFFNYSTIRTYGHKLFFEIPICLQKVGLQVENRISYNVTVVWIGIKYKMWLFFGGFNQSYQEVDFWDVLKFILGQPLTLRFFRGKFRGGTRSG